MDAHGTFCVILWAAWADRVTGWPLSPGVAEAAEADAGAELPQVPAPRPRQHPLLGSQGQNLALTVLFVPYSGLDCLISGLDCLISSLDCLIPGLDCLISGLDCLTSGLCLISDLDCPLDANAGVAEAAEADASAEPPQVPASGPRGQWLQFRDAWVYLILSWTHMVRYASVYGLHGLTS